MPRVGPDYPAVAWAGGHHRLHQFPLLVGQQLLPLLQAEAHQQTRLIRQYLA